MNWIYGKAAGFCGNSKEHLDYIKEGNFFQIGGLSASQETICSWSCLSIHSFVGLSISFSLLRAPNTERC